MIIQGVFFQIPYFFHAWNFFVIFQVFHDFQCLWESCTLHNPCASKVAKKPNAFYHQVKLKIYIVILKQSIEMKCIQITLTIALMSDRAMVVVLRLLVINLQFSSTFSTICLNCFVKFPTLHFFKKSFS